MATELKLRTPGACRCKPLLRHVDILCISSIRQRPQYAGAPEFVIDDTELYQPWLTILAIGAAAAANGLVVGVGSPPADLGLPERIL